MGNLEKHKARTQNGRGEVKARIRCIFNIGFLLRVGGFAACAYPN